MTENTKDMGHTKYTDLLIAISKNSESSYDLLYREFYVQLVLFSESFTSDKDVSENIVQNIFCGLWENRKKITKIKNITTYLYTSVKNKSLTHIRDNKKYQRTENLCTEDDTTDMDSQIMEYEIYSELYSCVQKLSPACKEVVLLKLKGLKNEEIAENLDKSLDTVRTHLQKAYKLIRTDLKDSYYILPLLFVKKT